MENKFTKDEKDFINYAITKTLEKNPEQIPIEKLREIRRKIISNTKKSIEDLNERELKSLVYDLMRDGAEVQGIEVEDFCSDYELEW